jgi:hypothetical protein
LQADSGFAAPQLARLASNRSGLPTSLASPAAAAEADRWATLGVINYVKK